MKLISRKFAVSFLVTVLCLAPSLSSLFQTARGDVGQLTPEQLITGLKKGGLIIYFRHAETDHSIDDLHPIEITDCSTQRNLSQQGRKQAQTIGAAIKRLGIPIADVVSSPFCRCRDTAELMFGRYRVNENLYFAIAVDKQRRAQQTEYLRKWLSTPPQAGMNNVIVSHTGNLRAAAGIWPKPEGAAWIIEPKGNDQFEALGMLDPSYWTEAK